MLVITLFCIQLDERMSHMKNPSPSLAHSTQLLATCEMLLTELTREHNTHTHTHTNANKMLPY